jgi:hypothetical protein
MTENNEDNRRKLAEAIIDSMEFNDLIEYITEDLVYSYENGGSFEEDWQRYFGEDECITQ